MTRAISSSLHYLLIRACAVDKSSARLFVVRLRYVTGGWVDISLLNAFRHLPVAYPFGMRGERGTHEISPDRQSRICARQTQLRSVIESTQTRKVRRVSGKPSIARSSGLAGHVEFEAARAHRRWCRDSRRPSEHMT
jgi:hypothetical protein